MFFRKTKKEFSYDKFIKKAARSNPFELGIYDEYVGYLRKNKSFADVKKLGLKLVVVSDTHGHLHSSYQKEYDNGTVEKCVYLCEYLEI